MLLVLVLLRLERAVMLERLFLALPQLVSDSLCQCTSSVGSRTTLLFYYCYYEMILSLHVHFQRRIQDGVSRMQPKTEMRQRSTQLGLELSNLCGF